VSWEQQACGVYQVQIDAALEIHGEIVIPYFDTSLTLDLNTSVIWANGASLSENVSLQPDGIHVTLGGGKYTLNVHYECP
jgi:hypothetical protein